MQKQLQLAGRASARYDSGNLVLLDGKKSEVVEQMQLGGFCRRERGAIASDEIAVGVTAGPESGKRSGQHPAAGVQAVGRHTW